MPEPAAAIGRTGAGNRARRASSARHPAIMRAGPRGPCSAAAASSAGAGVSPAAPAEKARRLASTPRPEARITSAKLSRGKGSTSDAASAPKRLAEITEPASTAAR